MSLLDKHLSGEIPAPVFLTDAQVSYLSEVDTPTSLNFIFKERLLLEKDLNAFEQMKEVKEQLDYYASFKDTDQRIIYDNGIKAILDSNPIVARRFRRKEEPGDSLSDHVAEITAEIIKRVTEYLQRTFNHLEKLFNGMTVRLDKTMGIALEINDYDEGKEIELTKKLTILTYSDGRKICDPRDIIETLGLVRLTSDFVKDVGRDSPEELFKEIIDGRRLSSMFNVIVGMDNRSSVKNFKLGMHQDSDKYVAASFDVGNNSGKSSIRTEKLKGKLHRDELPSLTDVRRMAEAAFHANETMKSLKLGKFAERIDQTLRGHTDGLARTEQRDLTPIIRAIISLMESCCTYQYFLIAHVNEYNTRCLLAGRTKSK